MNNAIKKMMLALAVCGALCGTAMAAPRGNPPPKGGKPPAAAKLHAPKAPVHVNTHHAAPAKHGPGRVVAHHNPPPPPPAMHRAPPPPPPRHHHAPKRHHEHNNCTLHTEDWCGIGASLIGGLIGGIIGAAH